MRSRTLAAFCASATPTLHQMITDFYTGDHCAATLAAYSPSGVTFQFKWKSPPRGIADFHERKPGRGGVAQMNLRLGQRASDGARALVTQNFPDLAIVIPTLNERANISILLQRLTRALNGIYWEAIFVDDDSADGTIEIRRIARLDARIRGIRRISRRGPAAAALSYNHSPPSFWLPRGL